MTVGMGSIGQNHFFSEYGHVAYQINVDHECTNMVAKILPEIPITPPTLGMRSIGQIQLFQNMVMLHIK